MNMYSFFSRLFRSPIPHRAAVMLVALAWCSIAFCDEKSVSQPEYKLIDGVDYDVRVKTLTQDAYGNFSADGVELLFNGQPVQLVDGKITNNWLETKDFGKVKIEKLFNLAVLVTADQNNKIRKVFAPLANLASASRHGDLLRVKTLLATKVDVNSKNDDGITALALASEGRHVEVVQALLAAGADVNARCRGGYTALMMLLQGTSPKDQNLAQTLIAAGADVNAKAEDGTTALMMALHNPKVVQTLLAAGADVNAKDKDGNTALMRALKWHSNEVAGLLRQHSGNGQDFDAPPTNWPSYSSKLTGLHEVRVKNPNDFKVRVGLRSDGKGKDFIVSPNGTESVNVPNGRYDIYFNYSSDPGGLYQGDGFTLENNGVEITITKVVNGNYGIRKVK